MSDQQARVRLLSAADEVVAEYCHPGTPSAAKRPSNPRVARLAEALRDVRHELGADMPESAEPADRQVAVERVTIGLIPQAVTSMGYLQRVTGLSKTDVINRAVSLAAFVTAHTEAGDHLLIRDSRTSEVERVHLL